MASSAIAVSAAETALRAREPRALVIRDLAPERARLGIDWSSWHLTDQEDMGEGTEQSKIIDALLSSIGQLAAARRWSNVLWSGDQFFAWIEAEPNVRVSPDVYLLDDPPEPPLPDMWRTWIPGQRPPRLAVEVVSQEWEKDYDVNPEKYAQLGTRELVIFDREPGTSERRVPFQVYRRQADGAFVRMHAGPGPVWSEELGVYLVARLESGAPRLRLAEDADATTIVPMAEEWAEAEARRANAEAEGRARAEARVRELEEALRQARGQ